MKVGDGYDEIIDEIIDDIFPEEKQKKEKTRINRHGKPDKRGRQPGTKIVNGKVVGPTDKKVKSIRKEDLKPSIKETDNIKKIIEIIENTDKNEIYEFIKKTESYIEELKEKIKQEEKKKIIFISIHNSLEM